MPLKSVLEALGIDPGATDEEIAAKVRELAGLDGPGRNPGLWVRALDAFTHQVLSPRSLQVSDLGDLAYRLTTWLAPDESDVRWNLSVWGEELGLDDLEAIDGWLNGFIANVIGPLLFQAGLSRAQ